MNINQIYSPGEITEKAKELFSEERNIKRLDGWFLSREAAYNIRGKTAGLTSEEKAALELREIVSTLPLDISKNAVFVGTQRDSFARSYALINPTFKVETFNGYCDPTAVFGDIDPDKNITRERIDKLCEYTRGTPYVKKLMQVYDSVEDLTGEVVFFIEQVTGHLIPDFRPVLKYGVNELIERLDKNINIEADEKKLINFKSMKEALECVLILAHRYAQIADKDAKTAEPHRKAQLELISKTLRKVPAYGAENLYEALQSFILLWQVMCLEQAPNPFAFSVGNADRIFEPYREMTGLERDKTAELFKHFLVFFNVADRSWAISQNIIVGGMSNEGEDLTNLCSYALLDAFYEMNLPQPILSVKLHKHTPEKLYKELGKFFFTPGVLTPSLFNDESVFKILKDSGIDEADLADYSVAGCQEPLIMGRDNANTTNSWLNLGKILELTLHCGVSSITGKKIAQLDDLPAEEILRNIRSLFYKNVDMFADKMVTAANGASEALSELPVPYLSCFMGGVESGYDTRDIEHQGTKYNGSGCLIHGLSVIADSFVAIDCLLRDRPQDSERLLEALKKNFEGDRELFDYLKTCPKFGNNIEAADNEAAQIAENVSDIVRSKRNYLGNPFRADWSSPTTHLLYGWWVGATPDGRSSRDMLNYGVDPLYGEAGGGMGFRMLSNMKLPFHKMNGGYASHLGIDPKYFSGGNYEEKGMKFKERVIEPLFFNKDNHAIAPYYLYVNVTTPEMLRKVLADPKKYAPSGVYIMRIHGTFVNFLDLSPAIQEDIIRRLDLGSTSF